MGEVCLRWRKCWSATIGLGSRGSRRGGRSRDRRAEYPLFHAYYYSLRILQQVGLRELEGDIDALRTSGNGDDMTRAQRLAGQLQGLREAVRTFVDEQLEMFGREDAEQVPEERLKTAPSFRY